MIRVREMRLYGVLNPSKNQQNKQLPLILVFHRCLYFEFGDLFNIFLTQTNKAIITV
jgi:hypothetical protein